MRKITLLFTLLLAACAQQHLATNHENLPKPTASQNLTAADIKQPQNRHATASEIAECQKQGGIISKQGMARSDFCVVAFADKGKTCDDGSQCQSGRCIIDDASSDVNIKIKGICAPNNVPFGCYGTVSRGKYDGFLCVD